MSAHSYIYVTIFFFFLKMMLTYHISHEKIFSTALYVHGRSGVKGVNVGKCAILQNSNDFLKFFCSDIELNCFIYENVSYEILILDIVYHF